MKKKSDKIILVCIAILFIAILSWFVPGGYYSSGVFNDYGKLQAGLYDILYAVFYTFTNQAIMINVAYILSIGGCYGVLTQTKAYRKLVDKTAKLIEGKEAIAMLVITLLMGIYTSITDQLLALFCIVPFIMSVFLRTGCKKLTAVSAAFGGLFIGLIGQTVGTYGLESINSLLDTLPQPVSLLLPLRIIIFCAAYILFNLFAILYMNKYKKSEDGGKYDLFCPEELNDSKVPKRRQVKVWPYIIMFILTLVITMLAYIDWKESFNITFFSELHSKFTGFATVNDTPIFSTLLGTTINGFGENQELVFGTFTFLVLTIIIAIINKTSLDVFVRNFGLGLKKISKVAFIYGFSFVILMMISRYNWPITFVNALFGKGTFNIFTLTFISIIAFTLCVDYTTFGNAYGTYLIVTYMDDLASATLIWHLGAAIAAVFVPTSFLLLTALTYADIPYVKWLQYIWKFVVALIIVVFIILSVAILM